MDDWRERAYRSARRRVYYKVAVWVAILLLLGWLYQGDNAERWAPWVAGGLAGLGLVALTLIVRRMR
jgi:hypothetical protein